MFSVKRVIERYRAAGKKLTPQRIAVFRALEGNGEHPSADGLFATVVKRVPGISRATVYNTLKTLQDLGEVHEYRFRSDFRQFDPNTASHHHCLCNDCGAVTDVTSEDVGQVRLSARGPGFDVNSFSVTFYGRCPDCRSRGRRRTRARVDGPSVS